MQLGQKEIPMVVYTDGNGCESTRPHESDNGSAAKQRDDVGKPPCHTRQSEADLCPRYLPHHQEVHEQA